MESVVETEETGEEGARKFVESSDATLESIQSTPEESRHIYHLVSSKGDSLENWEQESSAATPKMI